MFAVTPGKSPRFPIRCGPFIREALKQRKSLPQKALAARWPSAGRVELHEALSHYPVNGLGGVRPGHFASMTLGRMTFTINGEPYEVPEAEAEGLTVRGLLDRLGFAPDKIAVELNLEIVPRSAYAEVVLKPGDRLEIVRFVGGG